MANQVVLVEDPNARWTSGTYNALLFDRVAVLSPPFPTVMLRQTPPPGWELLRDSFVSVFGVTEAYAYAALQPQQPIASTVSSYRSSSTRLEEPEWDFFYRKARATAYWELVRLYAAQLVGFTQQVPDLCDDPWLELVHRPPNPEITIYPFRQINQFIRGQQFNLFFNQPRPWPVEGEVDTPDRKANYGIMLPWGRPGISVLMPDVIGYDQASATAIIESLANLPLPDITWQSTVYPNPPIPYGIVVGQSPAPGAVINPPFFTLLILSTGQMVLPQVGDATNYAPINVQVGDSTLQFSPTAPSYRQLPIPVPQYPLLQGVVQPSAQLLSFTADTNSVTADSIVFRTGGGR